MDLRFFIKIIKTKIVKFVGLLSTFKIKKSPVKNYRALALLKKNFFRI